MGFFSAWSTKTPRASTNGRPATSECRKLPGHEGQVGGGRGWPIGRWIARCGREFVLAIGSGLGPARQHRSDRRPLSSSLRRATLGFSASMIPVVVPPSFR